MAINKANGKKYVGFDSNWPARKQHHINQANRTPGTKGYLKSKFYNAIRKYGIDSFEWVILEEYIPTDEFDRYCINVLERKHIQEQKSYEEGYNLTLGGDGSYGYRPTEEQKEKVKNHFELNGYPMQGKKHSEETKRKISEKKKGVPVHTEEEKQIRREFSTQYWADLSEERKQEIIENRSAKLRGIPRSEETKRKISEKNSIVSDERRQQMRERNLGKKLSEETKRKIGDAGRGRVLSDETKKKLSDAKKGIPKSKEHRQKISEFNIKRAADPSYVNPNSKSITIDGVTYKSIAECCRVTGLSRFKINKKLNSSNTLL